ncbi:hypothetical protein ACSW9N_05675 [Clostridium perfringens]|jgi:hypothetical protein|uniref:hypothetical protein n=1 Tax=Clostridium perfringens TaxID=1502 RepID=UPI000DA2E65A|nr:hypothetical protein [Clostridium perfringens]MBI6014489.1 hypothetical protein [Clostridium perfringens]MBO3364313.1 hypothetical protein [Clostridium perfringens]MCX0409982.1 hypothetical protein [Clostridium perfringens]MDH2460252.1 hypothetical protein [Clostridium perfringens]MDH5080555.1 hypothetical protein [Clostridium perfringens]
MAKIIAPNKQYTGISASVYFCNGIGETDSKDLINWFKEHGYSVVEEDIEKKDKSIDEMSVEELISYADEHNIDIGKATSQSGIIEKIKAAEQGE